MGTDKEFSARELYAKDNASGPAAEYPLLLESGGCETVIKAAEQQSITPSQWVTDVIFALLAQSAGDPEHKTLLAGLPHRPPVVDPDRHILVAISNAVGLRLHALAESVSQKSGRNVTIDELVRLSVSKRLGKGEDARPQGGKGNSQPRNTSIMLTPRVPTRAKGKARGHRKAQPTQELHFFLYQEISQAFLHACRDQSLEPRFFVQRALKHLLEEEEPENVITSVPPSHLEMVRHTHRIPRGQWRKARKLKERLRESCGRVVPLWEILMVAVQQELDQERRVELKNPRVAPAGPPAAEPADAPPAAWAQLAVPSSPCSLLIPKRSVLTILIDPRGGDDRADGILQPVRTLERARKLVPQVKKAWEPLVDICEKEKG